MLIDCDLEGLRKHDETRGEVVAKKARGEGFRYAATRSSKTQFNDLIKEHEKRVRAAGATETWRVDEEMVMRRWCVTGWRTVASTPNDQAKRPLMHSRPGAQGDSGAFDGENHDGDDDMNGRYSLRDGGRGIEGALR
jgi:hypothetical protein